MKHLVDLRLVEVTTVPQSTATGKLPFIYSLTKKGLRRLSVSESSRQSKKSGIALEHTLSINNVAILAHLLPTAAPQITLFEMRHESLLKKYPIVINEKNLLIPDLFLRFSLSPPYGKMHEPLGILFEIDRNTEDCYQIKEKIRNYIALLYGIYQAYFGLTSLTICFVITEGRRTRIKQLLTWAEQELKQHSEDVSDVFLFGLCDPAHISPLSFFCDALWHQPFLVSLQPLIEKRALFSEKSNS